MAQHIPRVSQAKAEAGADNTAYMTALRTKQQIDVASKLVADRSALLASKAERVEMLGNSGGEFALSSDQVSATDNVLRIARTDGSIVDRIWDGKNFQVDWIPTGVPIGSFGTCSSVYTAEKILFAALVAGDTATLHLSPETEYIAGLPINLTSQNLIGHGATIKRGAEISSLLTVQAEIGASSVTVANASGFRVGNRVFVAITEGVLGGHAMATTTGTGYLITAINGNVISLGGTLVKQCVVGTKLVELDNMLFVDPTSVIPIIEGVIFDGNNSVHDSILDWTTGWALNGKAFSVRNCQFKNMPNECISIGSGEVSNCQFEDCWGSAIHTSNLAPENATGLLIENCHGININTKNNGHDEGCITFSNASRNITIYGCVWDNSGGTRGQGVFGNMSAQTANDLDGNFQIYGVVAKKFSQVINVSTNGATQNFDQLTLDNCVFEDVRTFTLGGSTVASKTPYINRLMVRNCEFINTVFDLRSVRDLQWLDNRIRWNVGGSGVYAGSSLTFAGLPATRLGGAALANNDWSYLYTVDGANQPGIYIRTAGAWVYSAAQTANLPDGALYQNMLLVDNGKVTIRGGSIAGPGCVPGFFLRAIRFYPLDTIENANGATTTSYCQDVLIDGLDLVNWNLGICNANEPWNESVPYDVAGWRFANINFWGLADNIYTYNIGLEVVAGCIAENCQVFLPDTATSVLSAGIQLKGPVDATQRLGGIAKNCFVPRAPGSALAIRIGNTSDSVRNANCIAINNLVAKAPAQAGSRDAIVSGNILLDTSTLAGYTAPVAIPHNEIGKQEGLY